MWPALPLLITLLLLQAAHPGDAARPKQVAIVGTGVGGASSAYWLKNLMKSDVNITMFEKGPLLGGRTRSLHKEGQVFELGASMAWTGNRYIRQLAGEAGLSIKELGDGGSQDLFAIFDGQSLVFKQSQWSLLTLIRLWWRYGFSWWRLSRYPSDMFLRFQAIYALQESGIAYERPEQMLRAMGLYDLTQSSLLEYIRGQFGQDDSMELFAAEMVSGISRVNYNQNNLQLNAMAGLVSLLPATEPQVFSIRGGNQQLAQEVLLKAAAGVVAPAAVEQVARRDAGTFEVCLQGSDWEAQPAAGSREGGEAAFGEAGGAQGNVQGAGEREAAPQAGGSLELQLQGEEWADASGAATSQQRRLQQVQQRAQQVQQQQAQQQQAQQQAQQACLGPFDAVIIAAPLESSGIGFGGMDPPRRTDRAYQHTVTTLVEGRVKPQFFGLEGDSFPYSEVMVTESARTLFSSLSVVGQGEGSGDPVYKLFSQRPLQAGELGELFREGYFVLANQSWAAPGAYPRFDPPEDFTKFALLEGLYYNNALENSASAMEMAAIAGRNSALLVAKYLAAQA